MVPQQAPVPTQLLPRTVFRNRYYIIGEVGAGGFGSVYKAKDTLSGDHLVAIKEVKLLGLQQQAMIEATNAFEREVSLLSQLDHPNLPHLYEHFRSPGHWYLVMDFIVGETLEEYQSKAPNRRLLLSEVLDIGLQLSAGRYLQLRGRFASITYDERSFRSAVSLYTPSSQKPRRSRITHHEHSGCAGEQT